MTEEDRRVDASVVHVGSSSSVSKAGGEGLRDGLVVRLLTRSPRYRSDPVSLWDPPVLVPSLSSPRDEGDGEGGRVKAEEKNRVVALGGYIEIELSDLH